MLMTPAASLRAVVVSFSTSELDTTDKGVMVGMSPSTVTPLVERVIQTTVGRKPQ